MNEALLVSHIALWIVVVVLAVVVVPLVIMIFWMGVYPKPWLSRMEPSVTRVVERYEASVQSADDGSEHASNFAERP